MREPSSVGFEGNDIVSPLWQALPERLRDFGQEDALALWYELFPEDRDLLVKDIECCRVKIFGELVGLFNARYDFKVLMLIRLPSAVIEPVPESSVSTVEERSQEDRERRSEMGLKAISDGKLAVLLLSGGQDNLFVSVVASIQYRALAEKAADAYYKLSNTRAQIQSYVFD
ncbi:hypothetical protein V8G54_005753 [Vigna mungo]|uniref:Uncharacterized protein n=1 Tax=Vigna mungo TaxID=3915 RepID=A0AAQ3NXP9_VIGMU